MHLGVEAGAGQEPVLVEVRLLSDLLGVVVLLRVAGDLAGGLLLKFLIFFF